MTMVPPIKVADPAFIYWRDQKDIDAAISRVLSSGQYILGEECNKFESAFAAYLGVGHAIGVASGTDAIELALRACDVGSGDVVLSVSFSAVATVAAIERSGAAAFLVDIDSQTYTIDVDALDRAVTPARTLAERLGGQLRAVVVVHLYGRPANLSGVVNVATRHGLDVIEDCAQAHGARWGLQRAGSIGRAAAFSFYPTKNLGGIGDGGAVVTSDDVVADRVRGLRQYGWRARYVSDFVGVNSRLDELQAAILATKLPRLDSDNEHRRLVAQEYDSLLRGSPVERPAVNEAMVQHVFHQYVVRSKERDAVREKLMTRGVATAILYPVPIHLQPAYLGRLATEGSLPETTRACDEILCLPIGPHVTPADARRVAQNVLDSIPG